ncbi:hypothetical protein BVC80_8899g22 [Macleaya cordata]|uniref:DUF7894 domain-containing protein n=1 Tax=Macleaya cordata TaxID=56857 RepID=A0A200Q3T1_MACCD|nr:hypothetical protein BVC80_8899g22 [Macleaya cordata]
MKLKVAPKVIFLFRDAKGFGPAISDALQPNPNSSLQRKESSFELSLEKYGIKDCKASFDLVHFIDYQGLYQVSVLLLQDYTTPVVSCVVNEVLASITADDSSSTPTLILPFLVPTAKLYYEMTNSTISGKKLTLYCTQIGPATDFVQTMVAGVQKPPPLLQVDYEPLACLLHSVRILKLPAVLLIGPRGGHQTNRTISEDLEVFYEMGEHLASKISLHFSKDQIRWNPMEKTKESQEPWRALYG